MNTPKRIAGLLAPAPSQGGSFPGGYQLGAANRSQRVQVAKVVASQQAWAKRVMHWHNDVQVDERVAYVHYFGKRAAA